MSAAHGGASGGAAEVRHLGCFGKLPSRGDFVKCGDNPGLLKVLDEWLSGAMDLMSVDPRWKITYDALAPLHFAFIGPRQKCAIAGHIAASTDLSKRRFPFMMMSTMELLDPPGFVGSSPLALARLWNRLETMAAHLLAAGDATDALHALPASSVPLELGPSAYGAAFADFLELQTVGALEVMLVQAGFGATLRQLLLALCMLLQPVMRSGSSRLDKSLVLPLPHDRLYANLVGAFWMHLIAPFVMRADFELALFVTRIAQRPVLVLGFCGAAPATLLAIMDRRAGQEHHIGFDELSWVEAQLDGNPALRKVSSYLAQPGLSLKSARDSLRAAFIGD
ncbi:MAG: type VI secretion system-associated protein TagF [Pseudomonadota bacterium]